MPSRLILCVDFNGRSSSSEYANGKIANTEDAYGFRLHSHQCSTIRLESRIFINGDYNAPCVEFSASMFL